MVIIGVVLVVIGFVTGIPFLWAVGAIVLVVGLALWLLGSIGHAVGGRSHYY